MTGSQVVGQGIGDAIRAAVPPWLVPVFVAITRLGNPAFFLAVFALDYWFGDRERGAHALALAIAGMGVVTALKTFFDAPRPSEMVAVVPISGYSFPSGHATGATIGYGILAYDLEWGSWRQRYAVAGAMILLVALSRVVLGVHFVRDVVAGIAVGTLFLAGAVWLTEHDPEQGFVVAVAMGAAAFVVSGASRDGTAVLGAALGGGLAWSRIDAVPSLKSLRSRLAISVGVLPALAVLGYVGVEMHVPVALTFLITVVLMAGVLAAPRIAARAD
ncbi:phosphatase PAP2 family protein [Halorussus sp. AFM4]|uniref:phosphatase PAP2 family protein n=1 Tax=Halorussus sp. AFM4 TaxID=3421651 RepID=UPI003EC0DB52